MEKEHIVPLIQKNVWRQPSGKRLARDSRAQGTHKSEEEAALDKEAAEAIIKGAHFCHASPVCVGVLQLTTLLVLLCVF